jgi:Amt family ammonium transporter
MSGDTAWIMTSAALVLLMVPGLALFYGGMVRSKNVLNMLNMNFYCLGIVPIIWAVVGMSVANGDGERQWLGFFEFGEVWMRQPEGAAPRDMATWAFLLTFAVITPALISGAVADRMKFSAWMIFVPVWSILV